MIAENSTPSRSKMPREAKRAIIVAIVLCAVLGCFVALFGPRSQNQADRDSARATKAQREDYLTKRDKLDKTVWSSEVLAQQYEDTFVQLWDNLRTRADKFAVFEQFTLESLILGEPKQTEEHDWGIKITNYGGSGRKLDSEQCRRLIQTLRRDGFEIVQTEWHHSKFKPGQPGLAQSIISMVLHARDTHSRRKLIVTGDLAVQWANRPVGDQKAIPKIIDATRIQIVERRDEPVFDEVQLSEQEAVPGDWFNAVYDLDGDGLPEILCGGLNTLYWNHGQGQFDKDRISPHLHGDIAAGVVADFDGDGHTDLLCAGRADYLRLFLGDKQGRFSRRPRRITVAGILTMPSSMSAGDIDADGDLDVWLGQYRRAYRQGHMPTPYYDANDGFPSYLLVNDGQGRFTNETRQAGLAAKRKRHTYSSSFVDLDGDGDLDLLVVSDFAGIDLYENDGQGRFTDVTEQSVTERHNFGMSHTFGDFNLDGRLDFYVAGKSSTTARRLDHLNLGRHEFPHHQKMRTRMAYGNRMFLATGSRFEEPTFRDQVARTGWSWGTTSFDFDNDGDQDLYVANGQYSGQSAKDYCTRFWCHDIYTASSNADPAMDGVFRQELRQLGSALSWNGFEHNRLLLNESGKDFLEVGFLMCVAFEFDSRGVISADIDADGKMDLLVIRFSDSLTRPHLYRNVLQQKNNWIGVRLYEKGPGDSPIGAEITLFVSGRRQVARIVTGDSFQSQHPPIVHFGLGKQAAVDKIEIRFRNGTVRPLINPAINQYHEVPAMEKN